MKTFDVAVIGGGASGLAAAIEAKRANQSARVCILERLNRVGKKILSTGNGRCNLGNLSASAHPYRNADFAAPAMNRYDAQNLIDFFESMGLFVRADSEGRLYPMSNAASSVLDALRFETVRLGIETFCEFNAAQIKKAKGEFIIDGEIKSKKIIIACGGKSAPSQGSNGSGFELLQNLGHSITPLAPSLVQLLTDTTKTRALKGIRAHAKLTLSTGGCSEGEILFTDYGLSGIASMDLSRLIPREKSAKIIIDFLPNIEQKKLEKIVADLVRRSPVLPAENLLGGLVHKTLGAAILKSALGYLPKCCKEIQAESAKKIAWEMKNFSLECKGTKGFNDAQVTRGGADTAEFDSATMQSKKVAGLFACGEVLDVDGACGGFNLAWAFASGRLAGASAAK